MSIARKLLIAVAIVLVATLLWITFFVWISDTAKAGGSNYKRKWKIVKVVRTHQQLAPIRIKGQWCRAENVGAEGQNMLGGRIATVWSRTTWCSNGSRYTSYERDHWVQFHGGQWNPWHVDKKFKPVTTNGCCVGSPGYEWRRVRYEFGLKAACVFDICLSRNLGTIQKTAFQTRAYYHESIFS